MHESPRRDALLVRGENGSQWNAVAELALDLVVSKAIPDEKLALLVGDESFEPALDRAVLLELRADNLVNVRDEPVRDAEWAVQSPVIRPADADRAHVVPYRPRQLLRISESAVRKEPWTLGTLLNDGNSVSDCLHDAIREVWWHIGATPPGREFEHDASPSHVGHDPAHGVAVLAIHLVGDLADKP